MPLTTDVLAPLIRVMFNDRRTGITIDLMVSET